MNAVIVAGGCILFLNALFCLFFYSQVKRKFSPDTVLKNIRQEVNRLVKEIDAVADRDISILEQRLADLRKQIDKADAVITELKTAREELSLPINKYTKVLETAHEPPISVHAVEDIPVPSVSANVSVIPPAAVIGRYVSVTEFPATSQDPELLEMPDISVMTEKVVHYTMDGFTPEQIAEKLNISISEVNLILSMTGI